MVVGALDPIFDIMSRRAPSIHGSWRGSPFPLRTLTKSSSSFCSGLALPLPGINFLFNKCLTGITDSSPRRFTTPACIDLTSSAIASDILNQTSWTISIRHKEQTLLDSHLYCKIYHESAPEIIKFVPQFNCFVLWAATRMYWPGTNDSG